MTSMEHIYNILKNASPSQTINDNALQTQFDKIVTYIESEQMVQAAQTTEKLFEKGVLDIRLVAYYSYAHFFNVGVKGFSEFFPLLQTILKDHWDSIKPKDRKDKQIQNSLNWLVQQIITKLKYSEKQSKNGEMHPIWRMSTVDIGKPEMDLATQHLVEFKDFFCEKWPKSPTLERLMHLLQLLDGLNHLTVEDQIVEEQAQTKPIIEAVEKLLKNEEPDHHSAEPETHPSPSHMNDYEDESMECVEEEEKPCAVAMLDESQEQFEESDAHVEAKLDSLPPQKDELLIPSEKMDAFIEKLRIFELLVKKNDYVKAALVAKDIDHLIENFDPLTYFPKLFCNYFSLVARHVAALSEQWDSKQSLQSKYLEKLYKTDTDMFLKW